MKPGFLKFTQAPPKDTITNKQTIELLKRNTFSLASRHPSEYNVLVQGAGDAQVVLIGEATHGTTEFYQKRAEITKKLIQEKGFSFVGIEGDWPDVYRVNRYVQSDRTCRDKSATEALGDFARFPKWMWRNPVMEEFVEWLKHYNENMPKEKKVGIYGLDLYSMFKSADLVIDYLMRVSPKDAEIAKKRYGTLNRYREDEFKYAADVEFGLSPSREKEVVEVLVKMLRNGPDYLRVGGYIDGEELFYSTENARLVRDAENYYRNAYKGGATTWNIRDRHMFESLTHIMEFYKANREFVPPKAVVWAHNSHIGDASQTEYARETGEWNIGQLARQHFGHPNTLNIGFTTYTGTVSAAAVWGDPRKTFNVTPAYEDSYEWLFHQVGEDRDWCAIFKSNDPGVVPNRQLCQALMSERSERMIGVQYVKSRERSAHYVPSCLPRQFDAVIHCDRTTALPGLDE